MRQYLLASLLLCSPAPALAFCSEPSAPYCATSFGSFDDQDDFDRCKSEMESYQSDVERYLSCRNDEAQEAIDEANSDNEKARSEYSNAVDSFNRRARGY